MAVLVEGISVIVRRDAIDARYSGGWRRFLSTVPNNTLCTDDDLVRVGFMSPSDVETFIRQLEKGGLTFSRNQQSIDMAVVDQVRGFTIPTEWLEFAHLTLKDTNNKVAACWLFEGPRLAAGVHMPSKQMTLATPEGWRYEDSLSANFKFVADKEMSEKLEFLRREDGLDVYLDLSTGKEVYEGRTKPRHVENSKGRVEDESGFLPDRAPERTKEQNNVESYPLAPSQGSPLEAGTSDSEKEQKGLAHNSIPVYPFAEKLEAAINAALDDPSIPNPGRIVVEEFALWLNERGIGPEVFAALDED